LCSKHDHHALLQQLVILSLHQNHVFFGQPHCQLQVAPECFNSCHFCAQGDECAEQDALRLKEQLDKDQLATVEVDGEQVTIKPNMVEIKQEVKNGG
jgi:hypothetical protein